MGSVFSNISIANGIVRTFTSAAIAGAPVYVDGNGSVDLAQANALATKQVLGLSAGAVGVGSSGLVVTEGVVALTTAQWDALAGTVGGLVFNTKYFLSPSTAGRITATQTTTAGEYIAQLGIALSTTEFLVRIRQTILNPT